MQKALRTLACALLMIPGSAVAAPDSDCESGLSSIGRTYEISFASNDINNLKWLLKILKESSAQLLDVDIDSGKIVTYLRNWQYDKVTRIVGLGSITIYKPDSRDDEEVLRWYVAEKRRQRKMMLERWEEEKKKKR